MLSRSVAAILVSGEAEQSTKEARASHMGSAQIDEAGDGAACCSSCRLFPFSFLAPPSSSLRCFQQICLGSRALPASAQDRAMKGRLLFPSIHSYQAPAAPLQQQELPRRSRTVHGPGQAATASPPPPCTQHACVLRPATTAGCRDRKWVSCLLP